MLVSGWLGGETIKNYVSAYNQWLASRAFWFLLELR
jgi:putative Mn2+ efflux pump MntP